jgi:hypothetical protein
LRAFGIDSPHVYSPLGCRYDGRGFGCSRKFSPKLFLWPTRRRRFRRRLFQRRRFLLDGRLRKRWQLKWQRWR